MVNFSVSEYEKIVAKCVRNPTRIISTTSRKHKNGDFLLEILVQIEEKNKNFSFLVTPKTLMIYKIFENFQKVIPNYNLKILPQLYYCNSNFLVFEDLASRGYKNSNENLNLEHLHLVLKVLANLHSITLIFEKLKSEEANEDYKLSENYNFNLCKFQLNDLLKAEDSAIIKNLEEIQVSSNFRRTLNHGNLLQENIFFQYYNGKPIECKLSNIKNEDYQPPVYDVLQLIFFNTSEDLRQNFYEDLLKFYYKSLTEELQLYSLPVEEFLQFEEIKKSAHAFLPIVKLEKAQKLEANHQDLKEIVSSPVVSREDCYSIIRKIEDFGFKFLCFETTPLDQVNGYLGSYWNLKIKYFANAEKEINCFVKTMPKNNSSKNIVRETGCFFKELFIYDILIPQLKIQRINIIAECLPVCYLYRSEEILIFEDLSVKNYKSLQAQIPYNFLLLSLTLKKVATLHASMLLFEEKMSMKLNRHYRLGEEYEFYLKEIFFSEETHSGATLMQVGLHTIKDVINLFPDLKTEENYQNFEKSWPQLQKIFVDGVKPSKIFRNVVSHGDLWTNNIMVKFNGDEPIDCVFVDFQCIRYCPPAHDFLSVIFLTTDRQTRLQFEDDLKLIYYEEFWKILKNFGFEAENILSFEEFEESIKKIKPQMILQALTYKMFTMCSSEEISSFLVSDEVSDYVFFKDRKEYLKTVSERSPIMKNALRDCIIDLYDLCQNLSR